jgi:hypothetical protein
MELNTTNTRLSPINNLSRLITTIFSGQLSPRRTAAVKVQAPRIGCLALTKIVKVERI